MENVTTSLITSGSLDGLLLTGLTSDGMDLLENFITKVCFLFKNIAKTVALEKIV